MPLKEIGGFFLLLVVIFVVGNVWFHLVEWVLGRIKGLFSRNRQPPAWHPLPPEQKDEHEE